MKSGQVKYSMSTINQNKWQKNKESVWEIFTKKIKNYWWFKRFQITLYTFTSKSITKSLLRNVVRKCQVNSFGFSLRDCWFGVLLAGYPDHCQYSNKIQHCNDFSNSSFLIALLRKFLYNKIHNCFINFAILHYFDVSFLLVIVFFKYYF